MLYSFKTKCGATEQYFVYLLQLSFIWQLQKLENAMIPIVVTRPSICLAYINPSVGAILQQMAMQHGTTQHWISQTHTLLLPALSATAISSPHKHRELPSRIGNASPATAADKWGHTHTHPHRSIKMGWHLSRGGRMRWIKNTTRSAYATFMCGVYCECTLQCGRGERERTKYLCYKLLHTLWHIGALCRAANGNCQLPTGKWQWQCQRLQLA